MRGVSWILVRSFIPVIVTEHLFCARGMLLGADFSGKWERKDPTFGELVCTAVDEANNKNVNLLARYVLRTDFSYRTRTVKGDEVIITRCYFRCLSYATFTCGSLLSVWTLIPQTTPTTTKKLESLITSSE